MAEFSYQPNEEDPTYHGEEGLLKKIKDCYKRADDHSRQWRIDSREDYDFCSGDQWSEEDRSALREQLRPVITFNRTDPIVDAVAGSEVNNRQEVRYIPRTLDDAGVNEVSTEAARWVRDQCDAEDEESDAFRDCLICGMGWTETRMDYEEDLDGQIVIGRIDPLEMWWDPAAVKRNVSDARWLMRVKMMLKEDVEAIWPDKAADVFGDGPWDKVQNTGFESNANSPDEYADQRPEDWDMQPDKNKVRVVEYQWWEREPVYRVASGDKIIEFDKDRFNRIKDRFDATGIRYVKQTKRVYYRAFAAGGVILEKGLGPCDTDFTFKAVTGKRDRNKNIWYGIVRALKDPQRWANKFYSQILHIINVNAKGGIIAEEDSFENVRKAETDWAKADSIVYAKKGAISRKQIMEKPQAPYPTGLDRLMELAMTAHYQVTGVSPEMMGLAEKNQPGVLEYQRRQAGLTILATLFDSLRKYRKEQGRVLLYFIREYISDGRLIRVVGQEGAKFVPLLKSDDTVTYDIIVDEAATAPNMKERTFQIMTQIIPYLAKAGISIPPEILDYVPFPTSFVEKWKMSLKNNPQVPEQIQKKMEELQKMVEKLTQENQKLKSDQTVKLMEFQHESKLDEAKFVQDVKETEAELSLKAYETERELDIAEREAEGKIEVAKKAAAARNSAGNSK